MEGVPEYPSVPADRADGKKSRPRQFVRMRDWLSTNRGNPDDDSDPESLEPRNAKGGVRRTPRRVTVDVEDAPTP